VLSGSYPLTVQATDGRHSATATLNLKVQVKPAISGPYHWSSTASLIAPISDATHNNVSIKDPTVVYYKNRWHVFATTASTSKVWSMVYMNFADWSQAATAPQYYMNNTPGYGNKAAHEVFYFRPQKKWYLISEWGPQYSTNDDISNPQGWTKPQDFFAKKPAGLVAGSTTGSTVTTRTAICSLQTTPGPSSAARPQSRTSPKASTRPYLS
jgi:hypothetical protein